MIIAELTDKLRTAHGRRWLRQTLRMRLSSQTDSIAVRRDMDIPFTPEPAQIALEVRHLQPGDDLSCIADKPGLSPEAAQHRADQRWLLDANLPTCWVAIDSDGSVCYMAWLLTAQHNELIRSRWGDWLPALRPDEGLLEGVYVAADQRGLGIMAEASCHVSDQAHEEFGVRYMLGIIGADNGSSLRASEKCGYSPYMRREDRWRLFRREIRFVPIEGSQWHASSTSHAIGG